jgi:hypothetical protein
MFGHIIGAYANRLDSNGLRPGNLLWACMARIHVLRDPGNDMHLFRETFLLFSLNLLDAILTIVWVRNGIATEGNDLMARLLDSGDFTFLSAKIAIGTITALVLLRWGNRKLARYGLTLALAVYISLMGIHVVTGLSAFGFISKTAMHDLELLTNGILTLFI